MLKILLAHGLDAGPTQRPLLAGAATSIVADIPALWMLRAFGSLDALSQAAHCPVAAAALAYMGLMLFGGMLYGWLFQRAANDPRGGWLFGMSFGFVLWMLGPIPLLQWAPEQPLLTGYPAVGLLLGELLWGLILGISFPFVHRPLRARLDPTGPPSARIGPRAAADPHFGERSYKRGGDRWSARIDTHQKLILSLIDETCDIGAIRGARPQLQRCLAVALLRPTRHFLESQRRLKMRLRRRSSASVRNGELLQ